MVGEGQNVIGAEPGPSRANRGALIAAAVAVVVVGAGIAFAVSKRSNDSTSSTTPTTTSVAPEVTSTTAPTTSVAPPAAVATTTVSATTIATTAVPPTTVSPTTVAPTTTTTTSTLPPVQQVDLLADNTNYVVPPTSEPPFHMSVREADVNGTHYKHAMLVVAGYYGGGNPPEMRKDIVYATDFDLSRKFKTFQARIGVTDQSLADVDALVVVTADGKEVVRQTVRLGQSIDTPIDVTGVLRLHIEFTGLGTPNDPNKFVTPAIGGPTAS